MGDEGASKKPRLEFELRRQKIEMCVEEGEDATEEIEIETLAYDRLFSAATKAHLAQGFILLIRDCYKQIWDFALNSTDFPLQRKLTVLGKSGIGKSGLLVYLAYRLASQGRRVYFLFRELTQGPYRQMLRINPETRVDLGAGRSSFAATLEACVLVDGEAPRFRIHGMSVLACTPGRRSHHLEWSKNGVVLYMPPWSKLEVMAANAAIYKVGDEEMWRRYTVVGGFPLLLFNNPSRFADESYLSEAIQKYLLQTFLSYQVCRRVCSIRPVWRNGEIDYSRYTYAYNSQYIRNEVHATTEFTEERKELRMRLMASTLPHLQGLRAKEAEWEVHELLFNGGSFGSMVYVVDRGLVRPPKALNLPRLLPMPYEPRTGSLRQRIYYLGDQAAWDAFFIYNGKLYLVQISVSREHTKNIVHLEGIMKKAGVSRAVLVFVGPPGAHKWFKFLGRNNNPRPEQQSRRAST